VPLHSSTILAPRRAATLAAVCATAASFSIAVGDGQTAPPARTIAEQGRPLVTPYFDIEANKAASMRALGLHMAAQRSGATSRYEDLEANKAQSRRAR
jgi:hypothetical protein